MLKIKENIAENDEDEVYEGITHLKLQQLLYYSQGVTLSITNRKLFKEKILASEHGPIIPEVYNLYKNYGKENIAIKANENNDKIIENIEFNSQISNILNLVYNNFAIYTAWYLRDMTHKINSPWYVTICQKGLNRKISDHLIKDYFDKYVVE